jgi:hypothetical protein
MSARRANRAWVAWREGNVAETEVNGLAALDCWRGTAYPFQWTALWPLLAATLGCDALAEGVNHARALLAPTQQRLPGELEALLEEAVLAGDGGRWEAVHAALRVQPAWRARCSTSEPPGVLVRSPGLAY